MASTEFAVPDSAPPRRLARAVRRPGGHACSLPGEEYQSASKYLVGCAAAEGKAWQGEKPIEAELVAAFWNLHLEWSAAVHDLRDSGVCWETHNERSLRLCAELKRSLGAAYRVITCGRTGSRQPRHCRARTS